VKRTSRSAGLLSDWAPGELCARAFDGDETKLRLIGSHDLPRLRREQAIRAASPSGQPPCRRQGERRIWLYA
jgi:hypothetical protein